jgi:hypothetical protein
MVVGARDESAARLFVQVDDRNALLVIFRIHGWAAGSSISECLTDNVIAVRPIQPASIPA